MSKAKVLLFFTMALILITIPILSACTKEVVREVPVERMVEKEVIVEVPVETIVEKEVVKVETVETVVVKEVIVEEVIRKPKGTLTYATASMGNENWLPWRHGAVESITTQMVMDSLLRFDVPGNEYTTSLAESWELSADELTATFNLRKGIQFQDGWGSLTSRDIIYLWEEGTKDGSIWVPKARAQKAGCNIEADGLYKVIIKCEERFPRVILQFGVNFGMIPSMDYVESVGHDEANKRPIGTGPFRLVEHKVGEFVRLEAVGDHWRQTPYFQTIIIKKVPEEATRIAMLKAGEADVVDLSLPFIPEVQEAGYEARFYPSTNPIFVSFGGLLLPERDIFEGDYAKWDESVPWVGLADDENALKVRKALNLAVDKEAIMEHVLFGGAGPIAIPFYNPGEPWTDPAWEPYPYDPDQAKKLLTEAGYPNGFEMNLAGWSLPGRSEGPAVAEAISIFWEAIGIKVKLATVEYASWRPWFRGRTGPPAGTAWVYVGVRAGKEPFSMTSNIAFSEGGTLIWNNEFTELDAIMNETMSTLDFDKRVDLQKQWGQWVYDRYTSVPIATKGVVYGLNKRVGNWPMSDGAIIRTAQFEYMEHGSEK